MTVSAAAATAGQRYLFIDGYNMAIRSHAALSHMKRSDGRPTGALKGYLNILWMLEERFQPTRTILFMDSAKRNGAARKKLYPDYKAQRPALAILQEELDEIKHVSTLHGLSVVEKPGVEADDLIASAVAAVVESRGKVQQLGDGDKEAAAPVVYVASADKDMFQCVQTGVTQVIPVKPKGTPRTVWIEVDEEEVKTRMGVRPDQIADLLALAGDTADGIPGIRGVGPVTAAKWLAAHGSVAGVIAAADQLPPRFSTVVKESKDEILKYLELTRLRTDHSVAREAVLRDEAPEFDAAATSAVLKENEMHAALRDFAGVVAAKVDA